MQSSSRAEIPKEVTCPICGNTNWIIRNNGNTVRFAGVDRQDWFPLDTTIFVCDRCGFVRLHDAMPEVGEQ
jgi:hypothetical protein